MAKKSTLTPEQWAQLVLQVLSKEAPVAQIARRAGISEQTLYRWRDEFMSAGKRAMNGGGGKAEQAKALGRLSGEIAERDQVIGSSRSPIDFKKTLGRLELSVEVHEMVTTACAAVPGVRLNRVLKALGVARSVWYARKKREPRKPGRKPRPVPEALAEAIRALAREYPWWGYKRIAVIARRAGLGVSNKQVYKVMKAAGLLQKRRVRKAELYQAARVVRAAAQCPERAVVGRRDLFAHPRTRVVVRGHGHRLLLALPARVPLHAALPRRRCERGPRCGAGRGQRLHGPLTKTPVPGHRQRAELSRPSISAATSTATMRMCASPTARRPSSGCSSGFTRRSRPRSVLEALASPGEARASLAVFHQRYNEVRPHWALVPPTAAILSRCRRLR